MWCWSRLLKRFPRTLPGRCSDSSARCLTNTKAKENAKHVLRAMKENARLGFWNGAPPPYGYRAVTVEARADAVKKRLEINPDEAELVKQIFELYSAGIRHSGHR